MDQFYINIPGALDYLDIDSLKFDYKAISKIEPDFRVMGFSDNTKLVKQMVKKTKIDIRAKSRDGISSVAFRFDVRA